MTVCPWLPGSAQVRAKGAGPLNTGDLPPFAFPGLLAGRRDPARERWSPLSTAMITYHLPRQIYPTQELSVDGNDHGTERHQTRPYRRREQDTPWRQDPGCQR